MKALTLNNKEYEICTIDFETYYGAGYTLSGKLNTSEYVRHEEFKIHGVGIKRGNRKTLWYTGKNIKLALQAIPWKNVALLCHNTAFDGFILHEHFDIHPGLYLDTLSMSRAVHGHHLKHSLDTIAKLHGLGGKTKKAALVNTRNKRVLTKAEEMALGAYCVDDVDDTHALFRIMYDYMPDREMRLIDLTLRLFCDPVLVIDEKRLTDELANEVGQKTKALFQAGVPPSSLMSNNKFAELLKKAGCAPPQKISPRTGRLTYAFARADLDFQTLALHPNPDVRNLYKARVAIKSTIGETRARRMLEAGKNNQKFPVLLNYSGAHTHRWSGGNKLNVQNLGRGSELRKSLLAPPEHVIVVADSAQIEARTLVWLAKQQDILTAFARGQDVYKLMASAIYNIPLADVTNDQRFIGKICILGLGYGMGAPKLQMTLEQGIMGPSVKMPSKECERVVSVYRMRNSKVPALWKDMDQLLSNMQSGATGVFGPLHYGQGFLQLPDDGLFLQYPELQATVMETSWGQRTEYTYQTRHGRSKIYGGLLTENVVQALARCIVAEQMLKIFDAGWRVVSMSHDEVIAIAHKSQAQRCYDDMISIMKTSPAWAKNLPLNAAGGWAREYSK